MRRTLAWFVVILTGLLLQSTLFAPPNGFTLAGARPELMYLITIVMAMLEGPGSGAVAGFAGGMAEDFLLDLRGKGSTALTLTLLGYVIGQLRQYIVTPSPLVRPVATHVVRSVVTPGRAAASVSSPVVSCCVSSTPRPARPTAVGSMAT